MRESSFNDLGRGAAFAMNALANLAPTAGHEVLVVCIDHESCETMLYDFGPCFSKPNAGVVDCSCKLRACRLGRRRLYNPPDERFGCAENLNIARVQSEPQSYARKTSKGWDCAHCGLKKSEDRAQRRDESSPLAIERSMAWAFACMKVEWGQIGSFRCRGQLRESVWKDKSCCCANCRESNTPQIA